MSASDIEFLVTLERIVAGRLEENSPESYTARLVAQGGSRVAQKVGEEAVELVLAATAGNSSEQIEEAADLMYHLVVLLVSKGLSLADVAEKLRQRHDS